jgi:putative chitinase
MLDYKFTVEQLQQIIPNNKEADEWFQVLETLFHLYSIDTPERAAGFISQCAYESRGFRSIEENMNYSETALNRVFGKYFGTKRNAKNYARKPEKIANVVYANRMGNGNTKSGDGWKYRGRGIIQLTGKNNYKKFAEHVGMSLDEVIEYLETKYGAAHAACWYWMVNGLNEYADAGDTYSMTKRINGGTHGLAGRRKLYRKAVDALVGEKTVATVTQTSFGMGDRGEGVKALQAALGIVADGYFGPNTHRTVKSFQRNNGLVADGIAGKNTLKKLGL